ncbi:hypothetical protein BS50DRAFT_589239 [Corynespora cassiicola Philippines]|uniref:Uncharacterized protein n=1 Tax=Corynespora cassiicola Philippines TaxID=1448308 RepID=A0A2T2NM39_CORCC|nr:hypothetical protein BS50DRAFT_589239 [Corynespora cassiicola Philippines]
MGSREGAAQPACLLCCPRLLSLTLSRVRVCWWWAVAALLRLAPAWPASQPARQPISRLLAGSLAQVRLPCPAGLPCRSFALVSREPRAAVPEHHRYPPITRLLAILHRSPVCGQGRSRCIYASRSDRAARCNHARDCACVLHAAASRLLSRAPVAAARTAGSLQPTCTLISHLGRRSWLPCRDPPSSPPTLPRALPFPLQSAAPCIGLDGRSRGD